MRKKQTFQHRAPTIIAMWLLVWTATQGLFMSEVLTHLPWDINANYAIATIWTLIVMATCLVAMPIFRRESLPKSKLLWLYTVPAVLLYFLPQHYGLTLNVWIYMPMILITVFWQDYLTFGVLQPALSKRLSPNGAAIITAVVFALGHMAFFVNDVVNPQMLLVALAGVVFALSRRYTGNIYIANIIHTVFYLM